MKTRAFAFALVTVAAWTMPVHPAAAGEDKEVTVRIRVDAHGLDLARSADARTLYARLLAAARIACTRGDQVALEPVPNPRACTEQALAEAVRAVNAPLLTQTYLANHSLEQASAHGFELAVQASGR